MNRIPWTRRIAAVASLDDTNRRLLFSFVASAPEAVGRDEAAAALELPRSTVSFQLDRLVQDGLLTVEFKKLGSKAGPGSGRPAKCYRTAVEEVAASIPDRNYDLAGELMVSAIEKSMSGGGSVHEALVSAAYAKGRSIAAAGVPFQEVLSGSGYRPEPDGGGGLVLRNCPFHRLADGHADVVCAMNGAFLAGAAAGCGVPEDRVEGIRADGQCCARIRPY
ncbi:helix-turn-helix transcriptional regulator [Pseudarthrobacter sp. N5]|uniref:helix-turn-helix transcriptional regulator n=1 Tax=Pseudarthrobacter sp. N5 TaxID=3418416 RepID=UPI003CFBB4FA